MQVWSISHGSFTNSTLILSILPQFLHNPIPISSKVSLIDLCFQIESNWWNKPSIWNNYNWTKMLCSWSNCWTKIQSQWWAHMSFNICVMFVGPLAWSYSHQTLTRPIFVISKTYIWHILQTKPKTKYKTTMNISQVLETLLLVENSSSLRKCWPQNYL